MTTTETITATATVRIHRQGGDVIAAWEALNDKYGKEARARLLAVQGGDEALTAIRGFYARTALLTCICMTEEDGTIETPAGTCPVHGWMV